VVTGDNPPGNNFPRNNPLLKIPPRGNPRLGLGLGSGPHVVRVTIPSLDGGIFGRGVVSGDSCLQRGVIA